MEQMQTVEATQTIEIPKKPSAGITLFIMLFSMTAGAMCMYKVPPLFSYINSSLNIQNEALSGALMSIFVVSGIILALPIGLIITKVGTYKIGLFALACSAVGSFLGVIEGGYTLLLCSRIIEGVGLMFLATLGPSAVGAAFSGKNRSSAMGLLMCFMAFGQITMLNVAPRIAEAGNWRNVWWMTGIFSTVAFIIWLFVVRSFDNGTTTPDSQGEANPVLAAVLKNKHIWFIGLTVTFFLIPQQSVLAFLPRYLTEVRGMDYVTAGSWTSIACIVGIPAGILTGVIADKIKSRKKPLLFLSAACALVYFFAPSFPTASYIVLIIMYGVFTKGVMGLCFSSVPDAIDSPEHSNMAVSVINMMQWIGIFISSILFGSLLGAFGWTITFYVMAPFAILSGIFALINKRIY